MKWIAKEKSGFSAQERAVVKLADLVRDPELNRPLNETRVKHLQKNLNLALVRIIVSRRRSGKMVILTGQHRAEAMIRNGFSEFEVTILTGLSKHQEVEIVRLDQKQKNATPIEKWQWDMFDGVPDALTLKRVTEELGLAVSRNDRYALKAVNSARTVIKRGNNAGYWNQVVDGISYEHPDPGHLLLTHTLDTCMKAWPGSTSGLQNSLLEGIAMFFLRWGPRIDREMLVKRLVAQNPSKIAGDASSMAHMSSGKPPFHVSEIMTREYNKNRRGSNKLVEEQ